MGWLPLLTSAAIVLCFVNAENTETDKTQGVIDLSQLPSFQHSSFDDFNSYIQSPFASQFGKFEHTDKDKEVQHNIKTIIVTKKVPVPYTVQVERKVPYAIKVPVRRPYAIFVPKPYLVEIPKPVPYAIKVPIPQPFTVEKHVPVPYRVPVDKPFPVQVPKPFPVIVERKVPVAVEKRIPFQIKGPVEKPVAVPVPVEKHVPFTIENPFPVHISGEKPSFFDKPESAFSLNHHQAFSGNSDPSSEQAQLAALYAEYLQKQLKEQAQNNAEVYSKNFQSNSEDTTAPSISVNQQQKVLSFLPGSSSHEHLSLAHYYSGLQQDTASSNKNPQIYKPATSHTIEYQWPKSIPTEWIHKDPPVTTLKPHISPSAYTLGDSKAMYKFSFPQSSDHIPQASHTITQSNSPQNKFVHQKMHLNQVIENPFKGEKMTNNNRKKNLGSEKTISTSEGFKPIYIDVGKKTPYINFESTNNNMAASNAQKYALVNSGYEKYLSSAFNAPKITKFENFDMSNAQPLIQTQAASHSHSTPYFQTLQHLHSFSPLSKNLTSSIQYAYPYQTLNNANMFALKDYANIYSNQYKYTYIVPEESKNPNQKTKDRMGEQDETEMYPNHRYEHTPIVTETKVENNEPTTYSSAVLVSPEKSETSYQHQVTTPKIQYFEINSQSSNTPQSLIVSRTTSRPDETDNLVTLSAHEDVSLYKHHKTKDHSSNNQKTTRADSIFSAANPRKEEKHRRKDKRRSHSVSHSKHHKATTNEVSTVKSTTTSTTTTTTSLPPSTHYTTVSQSTLPSSLFLKSQVANPLDNLYQTTSPQPDPYSSVEMTKNFENSQPVRFSYTVTGDYTTTTANNERLKPNSESNGEPKRDSHRRMRITRKPSINVQVRLEPSTTTASAIRSRGTRKSYRNWSRFNDSSTLTKVSDSSGEASGARLNEIHSTNDLLKVQISTKVEHSVVKEPDATPATSLTDITRTFPRKSRRRPIKRLTTNPNIYSTSTTENYPSPSYSSTPNYPSTSSSVATPSYHSSSTPVYHTSTATSTTTNSSVLNSPANYPSTSNYPSSNQPTPFQLSPSHTPTSVVISTSTNSSQTTTQETEEKQQS